MRSDSPHKHKNHPYRVVGSRPIPVSMPTDKADKLFVEWTRGRRTAERVVEELGFSEELLLCDLRKAYSTPPSDDAFKRSQQASYNQSLLKQAVKLGAPGTMEFMSIAEGFQTYLLWLSGKYPNLDWEPVFETYYRQPVAPARTGKPLKGAWNLSEEQELLLTLRIHADLIPATGSAWGGSLLDSYDDDDHEEIEALLESVKATHDCEPVKAIEFNLPQLRERANYYTTHADKLAIHSLLFDPAIDPYEDSELTNQPGFTMSDLLAVEAYYEREIERLTGEPYVVRVDPMTGMKPVKSIAFEPSGEPSTLDPEKDTKESAPEKKQEPQKVIATTGENPDNSITFEPSDEPSTRDSEKDTKESTPEKKQEPQKAIDGDTLWANGHQVFTTAEASAVLKISAKTLLRRIRTNEIRAVKMGNSYRIQRAELENALTQPYERRLDLGNDDYDPELGF